MEKWETGERLNRAIKIRQTTPGERAAKVIKALDGIDASDPEVAHLTADLLVLAMVPKDVYDAYARLQERCPWWAGA
jgi:hypothetical protein